MRGRRRGRRKASPRRSSGRRNLDHQLIELKKSLDELSALLRKRGSASPEMAKKG